MSTLEDIRVAIKGMPIVSDGSMYQACRLLLCALTELLEEKKERDDARAFAKAVGEADQAMLDYLNGNKENKDG